MTTTEINANKTIQAIEAERCIDEIEALKLILEPIKKKIEELVKCYHGIVTPWGPGVHPCGRYDIKYIENWIEEHKVEPHLRKTISYKKR